MDSPFRSESSAFRFLLLTIAAFAVVVIAGIAWGGWGALVAWLVVTALAGAFYLARRRPAPPVREHVTPAGTAVGQRVVVVVDETVAGDVLVGHVQPHLRGGEGRVLVVAPALTSHGHRWTDDIDADRRAAEQRLAETISALAGAGIGAEGTVGSPEPLEAAQDAIRTFRPDRLVVVTHARTEANWAEKGFVTALRERFDVPVEHVVA